MKRYEMYIAYNKFACEEQVRPIGRKDGNWVPASVAQALYDALRATLPYVADSEMEGHLKAYDNARAALSLADGEE